MVDILEKRIKLNENIRLNDLPDAEFTVTVSKKWFDGDLGYPPFSLMSCFDMLMLHFS